jgi:GAF domain-containing protein
MKDGRVFGVLDIDSPILSRFEAEDEQGLEDLARLLMDRLPF